MSGWSGAAAATLAAFEEAAQDVLTAVRRIDAGWDRPGLGVWDLRALVGHTSRSLVTVSTYLEVPAETEDLRTAADYVAATTAMAAANRAAVAERGREAGRELGDDPAAAFAERVMVAVGRVRAADPEALIDTVGGGMRVRTYLPTRTFELVVRGFDIADTVGLVPAFGATALAEASAVAAEAAVALGHGPDLLRALTGRGPWPTHFSVVS